MEIVEMSNYTYGMQLIKSYYAVFFLILALVEIKTARPVRIWKISDPRMVWQREHALPSYLCENRFSRANGEAVQHCPCGVDSIR